MNRPCDFGTLEIPAIAIKYRVSTVHLTATIMCTTHYEKYKYFIANISTNKVYHYILSVSLKTLNIFH